MKIYIKKVECPDCHSELTLWYPADEPPDEDYDYWQCSECNYVRRGEKSTNEN